MEMRRPRVGVLVRAFCHGDGVADNEMFLGSILWRSNKWLAFQRAIAHRLRLEYHAMRRFSAVTTPILARRQLLPATARPASDVAAPRSKSLRADDAQHVKSRYKR